MNSIVVDHLRRVYRAQIGVFNRSIKEVVAVEDISLEVKAGELFGLLGHRFNDPDHHLQHVWSWVADEVFEPAYRTRYVRY